MSDLPRLLLCSFEVMPSPTSSSRRLTEYLKALSSHFSVTVLSVKTSDHTHVQKYQGARLLRVPVGMGDLASRAHTFERAVRRQVESEEYEVVHFADPFSGYPLCEMKSGAGYRIVYEVLAFPSSTLPLIHPELQGDRRFLAKVRRQELFCLMNADAVITGSGVSRQHIRSLGAAEEVVHVLRAPADVQAYSSAAGKPSSAAPGRPLHLVHLGGQLPWHGLATLLRGVALAREQVAVRLSIVGPKHPEGQPALERLVAELKLQGHAEFLAPVAAEGLPKALAGVDIGVVSLEDCEHNRQRGSSLSRASEYLAAGKPLLAADLPLARELLPAAATSFYTASDARSLAEQIVQLAQDAARRVEQGHHARAYAERTVDSRLVRRQLLNVYEGLLPALPRHDTDIEVPVPGSDAQADARSAPTEPHGRAPGRVPPAAPAPQRSTPPPLPKAIALERPGAQTLKLPGSAPPEEPLEIAPHEVQEAEAAVERPVVSNLDYWFAQLAHGYCPPAATGFARHTPPTNFPGRDEGEAPLPVRAATLPGTRVDGSTKTQ